MLRYLVRGALAVALTLSVLAHPLAASADLPWPEGASALNMSLVGSLELPAGAADVWVHGDFAYLGTWREPGCSGAGVKVVDVSDPAAPTLAATFAQHNATSQEDMIVVSVTTPTFSGDLMAVGLQTCDEAGLNGVEFWDVTNPRQPLRLSFFDMPETGGVHELTLVQRPSDGRVLALLAVPFAEDPDNGATGEYQFVDATDPRNPVKISEWNIGQELGIDVFGGQGQDPAIYGHSINVNADGTRAVLSYWDAGFVLLDISDAANPAFVGMTETLADEEGNAHSASFAAGGNLLVTADEDYTASVEGIEITAPASLAGAIESAEGTITPPLAEAGPIDGDLIYVGQGCPEGDPEAFTGVATPGGDPYLADPVGKIALIDRGGCYFDGKLARAEQAGAIAAVLVQNVDAPPFIFGGSGEILPEIPAVMIGGSDGQRIKAAIAAGETVSVTLSDDIVFGYNDWGFLRFFDVSNPAAPLQIGRFGTANTFTDRISGPSDDGTYSVHNPIVEGSMVYASWYSDGVRAIDISDPANPREVGYFVPPPVAALSPDTSDVADVWGVVKQGDLLYLSDQDYGLYIVRFPAAAEAPAPATPPQGDDGGPLAAPPVTGAGAEPGAGVAAPPGLPSTGQPQVPAVQAP